MSSDAGYRCPACGQNTTTVMRSTSLPRCVLRIRRCILCGHVHETCEMRLSVTDALKSGMKSLVKSVVGQNCEIEA